MEQESMQIELGPVDCEPPLRFGRQKQLLVDTWVLADWWKLRRVQEEVKKHPANPILQADQPWEEDARHTAGVDCTASMYDAKDGLYKLWYSIKSTPHLCGYATSEDGVSWTKPDLGLAEVDGSVHNNICRLEPPGTFLGGVYLVQDPREESPERRFKGLIGPTYHTDGTTYGSWIGIGFSRDGLTWQGGAGGTRSGGGGGNPCCMWDERLGRYVMFHRRLTEMASTHESKRMCSGRYVIRQESEDLVRWSARRTVFNTAFDRRWPEVESMLVFLHEGIFIGVPQMLENDIMGDVELQLVTSRDGYCFERPFPDKAFIPRGPSGEFDDLLTWCPTVLIHDDQMRFYYTGAQYPHSSPRESIVNDGKAEGLLGRGKSSEHSPNKIGLATVPLDRLIGLRADEPVGSFLTRPFVVEGAELYVNANVDRELRVEVVGPVTQLKDTGRKAHMGHYIGADEEVVPGFRREDCEVVLGDNLAHRVRWEGGALGKLKGQVVRLRVMARMATVYAFQVV